MSRAAAELQPRAEGRSNLFTAWGRLVCRRRRLVLLLCAGLLVAYVAVVAQGGTFVSRGAADSEAGRGHALVEAELPGKPGSSFVLVFEGDGLGVDDAAFRDDLLRALEPLRADPRVAVVLTPYDAPPELAPRMRSVDGSRALALVTLVGDFEEARTHYAEVRGLVAPEALHVVATERLAVDHDLDKHLESDLKRAELLSMPLVLVLLLVVFGTLMGAILPLGVGVLAVLGGVASLFLLSRFTDVSQFALNIVTLIGLGVAIDYSLFVVSRFREELAQGASVEDAIARSLDTAGRAVAYSGLTVAIGLAGMLFFTGTDLASMGFAGALVVGLAVFYALTFLPALLAVLGPRIEFGRVRHIKPPQPGMDDGIWGRVAYGVMRRPVLTLLPVVAILLVAGIPFLQVDLASGEIALLPPEAESRRGHDLLAEGFPAWSGNRIIAVVAFEDGAPLQPDRVLALHEFSQRAQALPGVLAVESVVDLDPNMTADQYAGLYSSPPSYWPEPVQRAVHATTGEHIATLAILTPHGVASKEARALVEDVRALGFGGDGEVLVTGRTAMDVDTTAVILDRAPLAVAFVVVVTFLLVMVQVRSVLIPVKAILMNFLAITASFGALVWIFQEGNLSGILGFTPQPIDPTLPVILFCVVFGLSMDYEVLLLSRIHEEYERTRDNTTAVAEGLEASGRLITGAAAIMVIVFGAFTLADVVAIKAVGLGLAIAVAVDATLIRALLVPATMRLMGDLNWWVPPFLRPRAPRG